MARSILKPGTNTPAGCAVYAASAEAAVYLKMVRNANLGKKEKAEASLLEAKGKVEKSQKLWVQKASRRSGRRPKRK